MKDRRIHPFLTNLLCCCLWASLATAQIDSITEKPIYFYAHYEDQRSDDELKLHKLRNTLRFGVERVIAERFTIDCAIGLAVNIKNYAWESTGSEQSSNSGGSTVNERWSTGWGLVERPAVGLGFPSSVRIGYQF